MNALYHKEVCRMLTNTRLQLTRDVLPAATGLRVFVVEDEHEIRELWIQAFRDAGCVVAGVHCGAEALVRLPYYTPDVIVTDLAMPGIDGGEMITLLRQEPAVREAPIVLVSALAHGLTLDRAELLARRSGVDAVIPKPVSPSELVRQVVAIATAAKQRPGGPNAAPRG
jgi:CheY-like chemotaxis protein